MIHLVVLYGSDRLSIQWSKWIGATRMYSSTVDDDQQQQYICIQVETHGHGPVRLRLGLWNIPEIEVFQVWIQIECESFHWRAVQGLCDHIARCC